MRLELAQGLKKFLGNCLRFGIIILVIKTHCKGQIKFVIFWFKYGIISNISKIS